MTAFRPLRLLVVAGEVSGDHHAAALFSALRERAPGAAAVGLAGDACAAQGVRLLAHQKDLAVVGFVEALSKVPLARRLIFRLVAAAASEGVDGAVLVDSPDFNLPLARRLAAAGIPVVFYVSPQVWAWRSGRARELARLGRRILVLFRFEKEWYDARGLGGNVTWVGHPLVEEAARELASPAARPASGRRRLVLMPGSRSGEVRRHLPLLRDAALALSAARPDLEVVLVRADSVSGALLRETAGAALDQWTVVSGPHLALLSASDLLLVASGTATLEGALAGIPMVVVYRVHPITYALGRLLVSVKHVAMVNILSDDGSGSRPVPELIQGDATAARIAAAAAPLLDDPASAAEARRGLARAREALGPPGAAARAAAALLAALGRAGAGDPA
jgi:lipid-A-disaccharide synthase